MSRHRFVNYIKYIFYCLLDIIYYEDNKCVICGSKSNKFLCNNCYNKIKVCHTKNSIDIQDTTIKIYSSTYYSNIIRSMVLALKYKSNFKCGDVLSNFMIKTINFEDIKYDLLTYVPMTKRTLKKRGYNQAEYLAKRIGQKQNKKVMSLLTKVKDTNDQIGLNKKQRYDNLKQSFCIKKLSSNIKNKKVLLIDDVYTSGATTYCCALELIKHGINNICVLTATKGIL